MDLDEIDGATILALPMEPNDADATTVKAYLLALLSRVWELDESFNGKRPFGNSEWKHDLYGPLVAAGYVKGEPDEGRHSIDYESANIRLADALIFKAIEAL